MLKIRLARYGRRKKPFYRIIVADSKAPRDGRFVENIGFYDPLNKKSFSLDNKKLNYWTEKGAQANNSVKLIVKKIKRVV